MNDPLGGPPAHGESDRFRSELSKILTSVHFKRSKRLSALLSYIVAKRISGNADHVTEYAIALDVYDRGRSFDPAHDNIVRAEALRLRQRLDAYYKAEGRVSRFQIAVPKGSYVPEIVETPGFLARFKSRLPFQRGQGDSRKLAAMSMLGVLVLGIVSVGLYSSDLLPPKPRPGGSGKKIAISLLEKTGAAPDGDALTLSLAQLLARGLLPIEGLEVVQLTGEGQTPESGADFVLGGRVSRMDGASVYQVSLGLTRTSDSRLLWTENFSGEWPQIVEFQEDVVGVLSDLLTLGPEPPSAARRFDLAANPQAYHAFVAGQTSTRQWVSYWQRAHAQEAERQLLKAVELEPGFAQAYVELGYLKLSLVTPPLVAGRRKQLLDEAEATLDRAFSLDPGNATALAMLGWLEQYRGNPLAGARLARRAVEADPSDVLHHSSLASNYAAMGFYEAALDQAEQALQCDATDVAAKLAQLYLLDSIGRGDEAIVLAEEYRRAFPKVCDFNYAQAQAFLHANDLNRAQSSASLALECESVDSESRPIYESVAALVAAAKGNDQALAGVVERYGELADFDHDSFLLVCARSGDAELTASRIRDSSNHSNYRWLVTAPLPPAILKTAPMRALAADLYGEWELDLAQLGPEVPAPPALPSPQQWLREK